jgi:hypothetical protein
MPSVRAATAGGNIAAADAIERLGHDDEGKRREKGDGGAACPHEQGGSHDRSRFCFTASIKAPQGV